jgi:hypothetical protein
MELGNLPKWIIQGRPMLGESGANRQNHSPPKISRFPANTLETPRTQTSKSSAKSPSEHFFSTLQKMAKPSDKENRKQKPLLKAQKKSLKRKREAEDLEKIKQAIEQLVC